VDDLCPGAERVRVAPFSRIIERRVLRVLGIARAGGRPRGIRGMSTNGILRASCVEALKVGESPSAGYSISPRLVQGDWLREFAHWGDCSSVLQNAAGGISILTYGASA
jgi:hypothetical protein